MVNHTIPSAPANIGTPHKPQEIETVRHWHKQGVFSPSFPVGYVYLMVHGNLHKIGMSRNPSQRLKTIKRIYKDAPIVLVDAVEVVIPGTLEAGLIFYFHAVGVTGEWFLLTPEMVIEAQRLMRAWRDVIGSPA